MEYIKPITSSAEAAAFILALHQAGKLFHFDDSPADVIDGRTGVPTFTPAEAAELEKRVPELFEYLADPFELAVALTSYPDFFDMELDELENRLDVYWQVVVPNSDYARNIAATDEARIEAEALDVAIKILKGEYK